jgi:hypothetical protein
MIGRLFNPVVGATLVLGATLFPAQAFAQAPAAGFQQLLAKVRLGDEVWVKGHDGKEVKGKLTDVSPTSLEILSGGRNVAFGVERVKTVSIREPDGLKNGARIGFYVGAGVGGLGAFSYCFGADVDNCAGGALAAFALYAGVGVALGVGIDALIPGGKIEIYRAAARPSARLSLAPILSPTRKGLAVSVRF